MPGKFDNVAREIVGVANDLGADVIVMGSTGEGAVVAALVGSIAQRVVHDPEEPF